VVASEGVPLAARQPVWDGWHPQPQRSEGRCVFTRVFIGVLLNAPTSSAKLALASLEGGTRETAIREEHARAARLGQAETAVLGMAPKMHRATLWTKTMPTQSRRTLGHGHATPESIFGRVAAGRTELTCYAECASLGLSQSSLWGSVRGVVTAEGWTCPINCGVWMLR